MVPFMARKVETIVTLTDDVDGGKADRTVSFSVDGVSYEIDLSKKNAAAFEKSVAPWVKAARKAPAATRGKRVAGSTRSKSRTDLAEIREWAKANGYEVSERGRIARGLQEAYDASH
jgi:hypothetical protein